MPRIWQGYCSLLAAMKKVTKARRAFDAALQSLPITQHHRVWELYLPWVKQVGVKETALRVYRRYLKYDASQRENYVDYLESQVTYHTTVKLCAVCFWVGGGGVVGRLRCGRWWGRRCHRLIEDR